MKPVWQLTQSEIDHDRTEQCESSPVHRHKETASPSALRMAAAAAQPGGVAGPPYLKREVAVAGQATTTASVAVPEAGSPPSVVIRNSARVNTFASVMVAVRVSPSSSSSPTFRTTIRLIVPTDADATGAGGEPVAQVLRRTAVTITSAVTSSQENVALRALDRSTAVSSPTSGMRPRAAASSWMSRVGSSPEYE